MLATMLDVEKSRPMNGKKWFVYGRQNAGRAESLVSGQKSRAQVEEEMIDPIWAIFYQEC